jgi:hypothetical protein
LIVPVISVTYRDLQQLLDSYALVNQVESPLTTSFSLHFPRSFLHLLLLPSLPLFSLSLSLSLSSGCVDNALFTQLDDGQRSNKMIDSDRLTFATSPVARLDVAPTRFVPPKKLASIFTFLFDFEEPPLTHNHL